MTIAPITARRIFRPPAPPPRRERPGTLGFLLALGRNPLTTWTEDHFTKPMVEADGVLGHVVSVHDPAAIRHVFVDNVANYRKDSLQQRILRRGPGTGLLTAEADAWRLQRRTLAGLFTPRTVATFLPAMVDAAEAVVRRLMRRPLGRPVDACEDMARVTLDILARTIFSDGLDDPETLRRTMGRYLDSIGRVSALDVFDAPQWIPRPGRMMAAPIAAYFDDFVERIIAVRRERLAGDRASVPRDFLTLLIEASDPETGAGLSELDVRANIVTFIGAGHETTANTLSWVLFLLSQDEAVRARVEAELDDVLGDQRLSAAHLPRLVFTRAVIDEALRLYPPAPYMSREAIADDVVGGISVPAGSIVVTAPWVLHRHHLLWTDPDLFRPERFLPDARGPVDRFAYLPFGVGPRVCIGASFALQEATVVVAVLLRRLRFDLKAGHRVMPLQRLTLRPQGGLPMTVKARTA